MGKQGITYAQENGAPSDCRSRCLCARAQRGRFLPRCVSGSRNGAVFAAELPIAENCPTDDKAINVNYIVIRFADRTAWYSTAGRRGDVNADGVCDEKDAGLPASVLPAKTELTREQAYAADLHTDFRPDARDRCPVRRIAGK